MFLPVRILVISPETSTNGRLFNSIFVPEEWIPRSLGGHHRVSHDCPEAQRSGLVMEKGGLHTLVQGGDANASSQCQQPLGQLSQFTSVEQVQIGSRESKGIRRQGPPTAPQRNVLQGLQEPL